MSASASGTDHGLITVRSRRGYAAIPHQALSKRCRQSCNKVRPCTTFLPQTSPAYLLRGAFLFLITDKPASPLCLAREQTARLLGSSHLAGLEPLDERPASRAI